MPRISAPDIARFCAPYLLTYVKGIITSEVKVVSQVDALAWMGKMIAELAPAASEEDRARFKREEDVYQYEAESTFFGADEDTGY